MNEISHGSRLDAFVDRYAERTKAMTTSEIRALFAVASRPEVVSLAGGMPNLTALPMNAISKVFSDVIAEEGQVALQYGSGQGHPRLREQITEIMALEGVQAHPDDVIVTTGSQQALDLISRIFLDPGDVVLAEAPSYVGALGTFRQYQAQIVHIAMDEDGLIPESVSQAIASVRASGGKIKFLYTVPNFQNPAGVTLSLPRRREIIEIARRHEILIIEDNPYGLLGFDEEPYRAMRADDQENVIYLGSFSKTFAPGLRVGWAAAPHAVREKLVMASESTILCPSNFAQLAISRYLATEPWLDQIKNFRELYRERRDAMLNALDQYFPASAVWTKPRGGFYVWATLPEGIDTRAMLPRAITARVAYVPGTAFYADGFGSWSMRLSYCYPTPERIEEGVRRLSAVINEEMELRHTFAPISDGVGND
ncbi:MAG TPA: PLP-dependent aminotransferase family protein [Candidatus Nanopelagicaceae bacterium]|nr:PLP-dependent aminotransferase family protein [Candidatus Nanopelagicaceae bacterium]